MKLSNTELLINLKSMESRMQGYGLMENSFDDAFVQLRAMLQKPTDEERKRMLEWLDEAWDLNARGEPYFKGTKDKIRAFIMAKRTVTREEVMAFARKVAQGGGPELIIEFLKSIGISISEKGNVPVINEEGNSNEELISGSYPHEDADDIENEP